MTHYYIMTKQYLSKNSKAVLIFVPLFISMLVGQPTGKGHFNLDDLSFNLSGLSMDLALEGHPFYEGHFSISEMKYGFNHIQVTSSLQGEDHFTTVKFGGPDYSLEKFRLSAKLKTPDIIFNVLRNLKKDRISIPTLGLTLIGESIKIYMANNSAPPRSIDTLFENEYLYSNEYPFNQWEWNFSIISPSLIRATSTEKFVMGKGLVIDLDLLSWEMAGYGIPKSSQQEWNDWDFSVEINNILLQFLSQLTLEYSESMKNMKFSLSRGKFNLAGFKIIAIPDNNLEQSMQFHIGQYSIGLKDASFSLDLNGARPELSAGSATAHLKNLEIKLPEEIYEQPEIKEIGETIGIHNGLIKVRACEVNGLMEENGNSIINISLITPFARLNVKVQIHINELGGQKHHYEFHESEIRLSHLSRGLSKLIYQWEMETGNTLPRKGNSIVLNIYGDLENPKIKGIDIQSLQF